MLAAGDTTAQVKRHLTQELGMCCGGAMTVHLERIQLAPALIVFGAGHVSKPLAAIAAGCGWSVTVVDARADWATPERFPTVTLELRDPDAFARGLALTGDEFLVVATHDHALDQRIVQHLLAQPSKFLGMIGSVAKQRKFALRLRARGFAAADIARLRTPLGLAIGGHSPEEIAVSVVAELIAVRHGATPRTGWTPPERERDPMGPQLATEARRVEEPSAGGTS
jgi:xanthine dehydrogenase accessory factor